ncbi:MAG: glycosyl transferase family 1 [Bacteroidia bacterium]|nr:MAG: glycosyl transferase family 1 [Bacteroidia bacterium]
MTLLQITNRIPYPLNDGGSIAIYHVSKYMYLAGNQVIIASLNTNKHYQDPSVMEPFAKVYTRDINTDLSLWKALNNWLFSKIPYNIQRFLSQEFSELLIHVIQTHHPEVIQLEGLHLCLYLDLIKSITSSPVILRAHNVEFEIWERLAQNEKNLFKKVYLYHLAQRIKKYEIQNLNLLDGILAITSKDENYFRKLGYKGLIETVPVGVSEKWLNEDLFFEEEITRIGFLGSLEWLPNIQGLEWFLEKVWLDFHQNYPKIELHIAGKNPIEKVKRWRYPQVILHGEVPDALEYLKPFSVVIVPLLSGSGMRVKIIESMALGKCIITSSIGAEGIPVQPNEKYFYC